MSLTFTSSLGLVRPYLSSSPRGVTPVKTNVSSASSRCSPPSTSSAAPSATAASPESRSSSSLPSSSSSSSPNSYSSSSEFIWSVEVVSQGGKLRSRFRSLSLSLSWDAYLEHAQEAGLVVVIGWPEVDVLLQPVDDGAVVIFSYVCPEWSII